MQNKKDFNTLRESYKEIIYDKYDMFIKDGVIHMNFHFIIPGLTEFHPFLKIDLKGNDAINLDNDYIRNLCFHIGLIELISYYKSVCPKQIVIRAGFLDQDQIKWFQKLFYLGLRRISIYQSYTN